MLLLEIGSTSGDILSMLAERGFRGIGVEVSEKAIKILERKFKGNHRIEVAKKDFFKINERFDLLLSFEVLEHVEIDKEALRKWFDLLVYGGTLIFSVPAHKKSGV